MMFVRVYVGKTTGEVRGVVTREAPFPDDAGAGSSHEDLEVYDLGFIEDFTPTHPEGEFTNYAGHIRHHLDVVEGSKGRQVQVKAGLQLPRVHACPITHAGIAAAVAKGGTSALPTKVRAWLANMLPSERVDALGLARGMPISALKAVESIRSRRDPNGGSRMAQYERAAQQLSDRRSAVALARRLAKDPVEPTPPPVVLDAGVQSSLEALAKMTPEEIARLLHPKEE